MVEAFKQWRVYVEGAATPVRVYTDHENLEYFSRRPDQVLPPLPSLPILFHSPAEPILHTPYLIGAAVRTTPYSH